MKLSKNMITAGIVAVSAGSLIGIGTVSAHMKNSEPSELITKIASTFNVDEQEVKAVFEAHGQEKRDQMQQRHEERLQELVADGTLTQEQADAFTAKKEELRTKIDELKSSNANKEEVREAMKEHREAFKAWAEEQGIDLETIRPEHGGKDGMRHNKMMHQSNR